MDIILITTGKRPELLMQTINSLIMNADHFKDHTLTLVMDGVDELDAIQQFDDTCHAAVQAHTAIINRKSQGASASRNIGAGSIPKYRRQEYVMFSDDDVWFAPGYDTILEKMARLAPKSILSVYGHPFNHEDKGSFDDVMGHPLVISSVCPFMSWKAFDEIGFWKEPGGPAASEDYEFCMRSKDLGYGFAVSWPHHAIHTGMFSSNSKQIVGYNELAAQNKALENLYGVSGKIIYG